MMLKVSGPMNTTEVMEYIYRDDERGKKLDRNTKMSHTSTVLNRLYSEGRARKEGRSLVNGVWMQNWSAVE